MARYPAPTGYAPGGVSYFSSKPKRKTYTAPEGYAPGGVTYGPLAPKHRSRIVNPSSPFGKKGGGKKNGTPVGTTEDGTVVYQDPNTGELYTEATRKVHEQTDPILREIARREAEDRATAQADAAVRSQATAAAYAAEKAPTQALYDRATEQAKGVENAISSKFQKEGQTNVAALSDKLAQIGGAVGAEAAADTYKNADAAQYTLGMNDVARLIGRGAEAQNTLIRDAGFAQTGIQKDLFDLLKEIGIDYGDQRADLETSIPGQVQDMYDKLLGNAKDDSQNKYNRQLDERDRKDALKAANAKSLSDKTEAIRDQYNQDRDYWLKQQALAQGKSDKAAQRKADAELKRLDRQLKRDITDANNANRVGMNNADNTTQTNIANTREQNKEIRSRGRAGVVSSSLTKGSKFLVDEQGHIMTDAQGNKRVNPAYKPGTGKGKKGGETVDTAGSAKRNRAYNAALTAVFNKTNGKVRDVAANAKNPDMWIQRQINAALTGQGIDPNSKTGAEIRRSIFRFLDGRPAGPGTYHKPDWVK